MSGTDATGFRVSLSVVWMFLSPKLALVVALCSIALI